MYESMTIAFLFEEKHKRDFSEIMSKYKKTPV